MQFQKNTGRFLAGLFAVGYFALVIAISFLHNHTTFTFSVKTELSSKADQHFSKVTDCLACHSLHSPKIFGSAADAVFTFQKKVTDAVSVAFEAQLPVQNFLYFSLRGPPAYRI